ncbi:hypothetical protein [Nocardia wallacei]|uniref:hypothetical protein n=1 Tax=Nocardia wallacei TaxID=480035 RepID=UPI002458A092|nr:hypothetical protein [Nocardia wallacei]
MVAAREVACATMLNLYHTADVFPLFFGFEYRCDEVHLHPSRYRPTGSTRRR